MLLFSSLKLIFYIYFLELVFFPQLPTKMTYFIMFSDCDLHETRHQLDIIQFVPPLGNCHCSYTRNVELTCLLVWVLFFMSLCNSVNSVLFEGHYFLRSPLYWMLELFIIIPTILINHFSVSKIIVLSVHYTNLLVVVFHCVCYWSF